MILRKKDFSVKEEAILKEFFIVEEDWMEKHKKVSQDGMNQHDSIISQMDETNKQSGLVNN